MFRTIFRAVRTTGFLLAMCLALLASTIAAGVWAVSLTAQVATVTASAGAAALAHRKQLARALARAKAKARLRRLMAAVPLIGIGVAAEFERRDYLEWQADNPDGTFDRYGCEMATLSAEVVDEVLQDLPEAVRPSPDTLVGLIAHEGGVENCGAIASGKDDPNAETAPRIDAARRAPEAQSESVISPR